MVVQPHRAPWEGQEGQEQQNLSLTNACMLVRNFAAANYDVALLDVLSDATAERYHAQLWDYEPRIILLMASLEIIRRRNTERGMRLTEDKVTTLYSQQQHLASFDARIETTGLSIDLICARLLNVL